MCTDEVKAVLLVGFMIDLSLRQKALGLVCLIISLRCGLWTGMKADNVPRGHPSDSHTAPSDSESAVRRFYLESWTDTGQCC